MVAAFGRAAGHGEGGRARASRAKPPVLSLRRPGGLGTFIGNFRDHNMRNASGSGGSAAGQVRGVLGAGA
ncbi:hypothetical protein ACIRRH_31435, partial [Kitasatospora sp. NPDC101235]|uniref:hypothetical protein n=1 Tax=Kitasatospora sp. NPDC101235 TaxID=3364101 RepID=UPI0038288A7B